MLFMLAMLACGEKETDTATVEPAVEPSGEPSSEDTSDTDTTDTNDTEEASSGADALAVGDLVITEIMKNPCGVTGMETQINGAGEEYLAISCTDPQIADENGEWFEVMNASGMEINLKGLMVHEVDDGDANTEEESFVLTEDVVVPGGAYVIFGVSDDTSLNGGVDVDVVYAHGAFGLSNGADSIALSNADGILDAVSFNDDAFPDLKGHSLTLSPSMSSASDNDTGSNWCAASSAMPSGDLGTPGTENDTCQ